MLYSHLKVGKPIAGTALHVVTGHSVCWSLFTFLLLFFQAKYSH